VRDSKNIVVLNQFVGPTTIDTINAMCEAGMQVDLYAGNVTETTTQFHDSVRLHRQCAYRRASALQRLVTWSWFCWVTCGLLLFKRKPFEIFAVTNPPFNIFTALLLNRLRGIPYDLLIFDVYPDAAFHYSSLKRSSLVARVWSYLNRISFKHARHVFTISERMRLAIRQYTPAETPIEVIHNWSDNERIRPLQPLENAFLTELGLQQKRIVLYSGNFGKTHDIRSIVEAARLLVAHPQIHFLLIGHGEQRPRIEELIAAYKLPNVSLLPFTSSQVFPQSVASGEIAIVTLDTAAQSVSTPSKTYNSMAAGSAIVGLASTESELADLVTQHQMGVVVPPGDARGLASAIERLFADDKLLDLYRQNARTASHAYTPKNAQRYVQAILGKTNGGV